MFHGSVRLEPSGLKEFHAMNDVKPNNDVQKGPPQKSKGAIDFQ
jgi:hypothetical protein